MSKLKMNKKDVLKIVQNMIALTLGNLILAFGTSIFLTKLNIVAGGLSGIGIILQYHLGQYVGGQVIDIAVFILSWTLWFIGFIFVNKEFAMKTLASTILYPLFLALFLRVPVFGELSNVIAFYGMNDPSETVPIGNLLLCGIFGGVFVGAGVSLTFVGGGSTGGTDVLIALICKYFNIRESVISFLLDGIVIVLGMFLIPNNVVPSLCGIISAFVTALLIEVIYVGDQTSYQVDIISDKWEEISEYAQNTLERGATIIHANGGYKGEERIILRIVFDKRQYNKLRTFIAKTDPKAFVTYTQTNAVYGEGFKTLNQNKTKK